MPLFVKTLAMAEQKVHATLALPGPLHTPLQRRLDPPPLHNRVGYAEVTQTPFADSRRAFTFRRDVRRSNRHV